MFGVLLPVIAPLAICAGLGWAWARLKMPFDTQAVTGLVAGIGAPCLVFSTLVDLEVPPRALAEMAAATLAALTVFAATGVAVLAAAGWSIRAFLTPLTFANTGNMGLPVALFAFGDPGLELAIIVFAVHSTLQHTAGAWVMSGSLSPMRVLKTPIPYAVLAALALSLTGTDPPLWLFNTTRLLGGLAIPLLLLTLGVSLAGLRVRSLRRSLVLAGVRLAMGIVTGLALSTLLGFEGVMRGVLVTQCAMPVAVFNYLHAVRYGCEPEAVASLILVSTLVGFAALPLVLTLVL